MFLSGFRQFSIQPFILLLHEEIMQLAERHSWDVDPAQAQALQEALAAEVDVSTPLGPWETVAAADVSYNKYSEWLYAAVVVLRAGTLELIERVGVAGEARFPYVPGLLSFREAPPVLEAFRRLQTVPDVILCDGQGIAHPRRIGLASHLGLWLERPTIGSAKSRLWGDVRRARPESGRPEPAGRPGRGRRVGRPDAFAGQAGVRLPGPSLRHRGGCRRRPGHVG